MNQRLSVVFSFRNEEETLPELVKRVRKSLEGISSDYELIFVNDASTDGSLGFLKQFALEDPRVKIVNLSRRFGYNQGLVAGIRYSKGDAVITMDADLQDPPEVIPELVKKWLEGAEVVHTVRKERLGEPALKLWLTKAAYRLIGAISEVVLPEDAGTFKLMSRRAVNEVMKFNDRDPYFRGLVASVGFKQDRVLYRREKRFAGKGHMPILASRGPIKEFVSGLTSFSIVPLVLSFFLGLILFLAAVAALLICGILKLTGSSMTLGDLPWVWGSFFTGIQLVCLGLVGLYIGRIWNEVSNRPNYIVEDTVNLEDGRPL